MGREICSSSGIPLQVCKNRCRAGDFRGCLSSSCHRTYLVIVSVMTPDTLITIIDINLRADQGDVPK